MTTILTLHWNLLDHELKGQILSRLCFNERFTFYTWDELTSWMKEAIQDNLRTSTNGAVIVEA